jgi:NitT/TauT family transport system permease protein
MIRRPISPKWRVALGAIAVLTVSFIYLGLSYKQHKINPHDTTIPDINQLIVGVQKVFEHDALGKTWFFQDAKATLTRLFLGLSIGITCSLVLGLAMGVSSIIESILLPPLNFLAKIPPTAMLAVFFVMFGTDLQMYTAMIAFGVMPILTQTIYQAAKFDVPDELIYKSYTLGASKGEVIELILLHILPRIIEAIRLQVGPALVYLIAAEMMTSDVGFGYRLRIQSRLLNMNVVYVYLVFLGWFGYFMDWLLTTLNQTFCRWFYIKG